MRQLSQRLRLASGLDAQVFPTFLLRFWQSLVGGVMILLIPLWLDVEQQGYYYTFASLIALQVFFELGMNQVVVQLVSHDYAQIEDSSEGSSLIGSRSCIDRLAVLVILLHRWYALAAILFFLVVGISGLWFFLEKGDLPFPVWAGPWLILVLLTAINLYFSASLTTLEGCGMLAGVARMRLHQSLIGSILMWLVLAMGAGLWAMSLVPLVAAIYTAYWLKNNNVIFAKLRFHTKSNRIISTINWRRDVFPFQWRIAVSWISGYFIFQLFTPIVFTSLGPAEAGRLGITMAVFSGLLTVGMSWVNAKVPAFATHVSRGTREDLNRLFISTLRRSFLFIVLSVLIIIAVLNVLIHYKIPMIERFASLPVVICLSLVTLVNSIIFAAAAYMRAHKEEPMMYQSVTVGLITLGSAILTSQYGVLIMMISYAIICSCVALPWTLILLRRYYYRKA